MNDLNKQEKNNIIGNNIIGNNIIGNNNNINGILIALLIFLIPVLIWYYFTFVNS